MSSEWKALALLSPEQGAWFRTHEAAPHTTLAVANHYRPMNLGPMMKRALGYTWLPTDDPSVYRQEEGTMLRIITPRREAQTVAERVERQRDPDPPKRRPHPDLQTLIR